MVDLKELELGDALDMLDGRTYLVPHDIEGEYEAWLEVCDAARRWLAASRGDPEALKELGGWAMEFSRGATQYKWRCGNCGGDHGDSGCDDPDLYDYTLWRMKPEVTDPGVYRVFGPLGGDDE